MTYATKGFVAMNRKILIHCRRVPAVFLILLLVTFSLQARLSSSAGKISYAKQIVEDILRDTRLDRGDEVWGNEFKTDIERTQQIFTSSNLYSVFYDLGIEKPMARLLVYAQKKADPAQWVQQMQQFDRAADELDPIDKSKYYFARGLVQLQLSPTASQGLPEEFFKAAEFGYSAALMYDYAQKYTNKAVDDLFFLLAQAYERGDYPQQALYYYIKALKNGNHRIETFTNMLQSSLRLDQPAVSHMLSRLFFYLYSLYERGYQLHPDSLPLPQKINADAPLKTLNDLVLSLPAVVTSEQEPSDRQIERFFNNYIEPVAGAMGYLSDAFLIDCIFSFRHIDALTRPLALMVRATADQYMGDIEKIIIMLYENPAFANDSEIASWAQKRYDVPQLKGVFDNRFPNWAQAQ